MGSRVPTIAVGLVLSGFCGGIRPVQAADASASPAGRDSLRITKTERLDFTPGGVIRIDGSHGDLNVEGWDRPEVEVTVTRSTLGLYGSKDADAARQRLERIAVSLHQDKPGEIRIATTFPGRTLRRLNRGRSDVMLEYRIHVPRDSHLIVHHGLGTVSISNVTGDLEARASTGDIVVVLPERDHYAIDARTRLGGVSCDFAGAASRSGLTGRALVSQPAGATHHILLRLGTGDINIDALPSRASE